MTLPDEGGDWDSTGRRRRKRGDIPNADDRFGDEGYDDRRAVDPLLQRLLDELQRIETEKSRGARYVPEPSRPALTDEEDDDWPFPEDETRRPSRVPIAAALLTGLALLSLALGALAPRFRFDIPLLPTLWNLGRSFLPEAILPFVPVAAAALAWAAWGLAAGLRRRRAHPRIQPEVIRTRIPAPPSPEPPTRSKTKRGIGGRMIRELRPYIPSLAVLFVASLAAVPLALITPLPMKLILDNVVGPHPLPAYLGWLSPNPSATSKETVMLIAIGILLGGTVLSSLQNLARDWLSNRLGNRMDVDMRVRLFRQLQRLSTAYHDEKGTVDSTYRIQYDATSLRSLAMDALIPLVTSLLTLGGMIGIMASLDWQLALIALSVSPFMLLLTLVFRRRIRIGWRRVKSSESAAMSAAQESLSAARVVKAFGQEDRENRQFHSRYAETASAALRVIVEQGMYSLVVGVVTAVGLAAVLFIGVQHVQASTLLPGDLFLVYYYLTQLYNPLKDIGKKVLDIQKATAGMERFLEVIDERADVPEKPNARPLTRATGHIAFEGVSFGYNGSRLVLRDVSFDLPAGRCLGIVGPTGSGKTTLANLLVRFFDPAAGAITLDGTDLRDYKVADLRNQFAVVLQDTLLFSTTIAENIRFAKPEASDRAIEAAAKMANVHDFIMSLPEGYDTQVGERGMKLSGGERQRISLARAFLKNAPILILDEPTSSLDLKTETFVIDAIRRLMKGRTTLMIAHRPSTLRSADAILILEPNGRCRLTDEVESSLERLAADGMGGPGGGLVDEEAP